jgi:hypothetical protein
MKHLELYESFGNRKELIFKSRQGRVITVSLLGGRIDSIDNQAGVRFPFMKGQPYTRSIEVWACNNGFTINGEDTCPEKKVFGIKVSDIPQGHELRRLFPNKFR